MSKRDLTLADEIGHALEIDGYVRRREVERLTGFSARTLARKVAAGEFPPPDVRGGNGAASRWRRSTVRRALDAMESHAR